MTNTWTFSSATVEIVRDAFARNAATEMGTEGDSFFAVFPSARDAVVAAIDIQRAMAAEGGRRD